ncbi:MAG: hypothetical protein IT428_25350 [Planctomycetaceae bacterium]|nr:hypothetical protein [Planctomycetaceae bacterium]
MTLKETIDRINKAVAAGRADNVGGTVRPEADVSNRGDLVTGPGFPEMLVGRFRLTPLSPWVRWTCHDSAAFPSLCAAFDRMTRR